MSTQPTMLQERLIGGRHAEPVRSLARCPRPRPHSVKNLRSGLIDMVSIQIRRSRPSPRWFIEAAWVETEATIASVDFQLYTSENLPRADIIS